MTLRGLSVFVLAAFVVLALGSIADITAAARADTTQGVTR